MTDKPPGRVCYLDTNVFIGAFERSPEQAEPLRVLFEHFKKVPKAAVTSELTLAELFVLPSAPQMIPTAVKRRLYMDLLIWSRFIDLRPVSRTILYKSADIPRHANAKHSLPDAIHMATAIDSGCRLFMTDDKRVRALPASMRIVRPDPTGIATVLKALHG